ncbi:MAG: NAD-dependent epimerase/dehydratase family protein, partial [Acidimicrobiaceae bacterium]|nr:NAD-dependent epimerase/dehydratase family protein [Acidimicrobiaceae bacterium]
MRVVVTGATGNVGTALLEVLAADPVVDEIVALARREPGRSWPKTTFSSVDVLSDDLTPHLHGADAVVHLAWVFQPTHRPLETWGNNVRGSIRLFRAVAEGKVPTLVYASSVGAYSPAYGREVDESWPTESLPTAGYGREKAYLERVLDAFEARHPEIRVIRIRTAFVFQQAAGSQQRRLFAGPFAPTSVLRVGHIPIVPYPSGLRFQALHATDAAAAYHLALTSTSRGAFNLAADPVIDGTVLAELLGGR